MASRLVPAVAKELLAWRLGAPEGQKEAFWRAQDQDVKEHYRAEAHKILRIIGDIMQEVDTRGRT